MKTTAYPIKALCIMVLLATSARLAAQEEKEGQGVSRELILEREYAPSVQDANKVNTLPAVKEPVITRAPIDYALLTTPADPQREIGLLPADRLKTEIDYDKRRGYLNLGAGTYLNINGDAGYHLLSTEKDKLNFFVSHRSTNGKVKYMDGFMKDETVKAKLNDNRGGFDFRHDFSKAAIKLAALYGYSAFNYYGLPAPSVFSDLRPGADTETNQVSQQITVNGGVESMPGAAPVDYRLDLDYTRFAYKYGMTEHTLGARPSLSAAFGGNQRIGIDAKFNYFSYDLHDAPLSSARNYLEGTLMPQYGVEGDFWNVRLGANVMFITGDYSKLFASPNVGVDLNVGAKTVLYLNAGGGIRSNSAFLLSRENRYSDPYERAIASRILLDGVVGVKSGVAPGFWFNVFGGYKITGDDYFFIPYMSAVGFGNLSRTLPLDSKQLHGGLELKYAYQRLLELSLKGVYNHWKVENKRLSDELTPGPEWKAYGRPVSELTAGFLVRPVDKMAVALDYYLAAGRIARENWNEKMKDINELNFTGSYTINNSFGVYVKANNLLFQRYEMVYGYPLQGFHIMGGININF